MQRATESKPPRSSAIRNAREAARGQG
jgi:hypothetical protein